MFQKRKRSDPGFECRKRRKCELRLNSVGLASERDSLLDVDFSEMSTCLGDELQMSPRQLYQRGQQYFQNGKLSEALRCFLSVLEKKPAQRRVCYCIGRIMTDLGEHEKALSYYRRSAKFHMKEAFRAIGMSYFHGQGVERDVQLAQRYFQMAWERGDSESLLNLGFLEMQSKNYERAKHYYVRAASLGNAKAMYNVGILALEQDQDLETAIYYLNNAASKGDAQAFCCLGDIYQCGLGVERDTALAKQFYQQALEHGDDEAQQRLVMINNVLHTQTCAGGFC